MVVQYKVFGQQVGSHVLAMITLGTTAAVAYLSTGGSKAPTTPPIQASSSDEEKFIKDFIAAAEKEAPSKH